MSIFAEDNDLINRINCNLEILRAANQVTAVNSNVKADDLMGKALDNLDKLLPKEK